MLFRSEEWLRTRFPGFAKDLDWSMWNLAPEDQQIESYFRGDEAFAFENMHPTKPRIEGALPRYQCRAFLTQRDDGGEIFREIATRIDTVAFFPHVERGLLVFRGMVQIGEDDAADVNHVLIAAEDLGAPRPVEHYRGVLAKRLDKRSGALESLRDDDLMPPVREGAKKTPDFVGDMEELTKREGILRQNLRRKAEKQLEELRERMRGKGIDPDQHVPKELPPTPRRRRI